MKNSLSTKGLSLSQAQSISNLCNQACRDIDSKLSNINNASKELTLNGGTYVETQGHPITGNIHILLKSKATLHATQAFLMENIRAKDMLLKEIQNKPFIFDQEEPEYPELPQFYPTSLVDENWGWAQLSNKEYNEYLEAEAFASHYGQFIHKGGKLDKLRTELPGLKTLEWIEVEAGKKTPLKVNIHHTIDQLGVIHEELAAVHRTHEQKVNYYKAKVKNLVTQENARISRGNADAQAKVNEERDNLMTAYRAEREKYLADYRKASMEFEEARQKEIQEAVVLRIEVDARFKPVVDSFLKQIEE
jgi:hypothetical protein